MIRKSIIAILVVVAAVAAFVSWQFPAKKKYSEARDALLVAGQYTLQPIDGSSQRFLETVRASWEIQTDESTDPVFSDIAKLTGMRNSVRGVLDFHAYRMPNYSFLDHSRNRKASIIGATQATALSVSVVGRIHYKDGLAFIKIHDSIVDVYQDVPTGVRRQRFVATNESERRR